MICDRPYRKSLTQGIKSLISLKRIPNRLANLKSGAALTVVILISQYDPCVPHLHISEKLSINYECSLRGKMDADLKLKNIHQLVKLPAIVGKKQEGNSLLFV